MFLYCNIKGQISCLCQIIFSKKIFSDTQRMKLHQIDVNLTVKSPMAFAFGFLDKPRHISRE